jgi:hypothetical protein
VRYLLLDVIVLYMVSFLRQLISHVVDDNGGERGVRQHRNGSAIRVLTHPSAPFFPFLTLFVHSYILSA